MNKLRSINSIELILNLEDEKYYYHGRLYSGVVKRYEKGKVMSHYMVLEGVIRGIHIEYDQNGQIKLIGTYNDIRNGYFIEVYPNSLLFWIVDMESIIEIIKVDNKGNTRDQFSIGQNNTYLKSWKENRAQYEDEGLYDGGYDIMPFYNLQNQLREKVIKSNELTDVKYVAGVDVAYNELQQKMVGVFVVLDASTFQIIEESWHEMKITFPYIPGLFSFREIPPLLEAYKKLKIKPDLIVCDGHGIAHPKGVGMATHLGLELDIPTIGCAKKRLIGAYDKELLNKERSSSQSLVWDDEVVGVALRTQIGVNPLFVSIGHKIDLESAIEWVLKLCPNYRLPETTRQADQLVNKLLKERTEIDLYGDDI